LYNSNDLPQVSYLLQGSVNAHAQGVYTDPQELDPGASSVLGSKYFSKKNNKPSLSKTFKANLYLLTTLALEGPTRRPSLIYRVTGIPFWIRKLITGFPFWIRKLITGFKTQPST
jgi:hypothetical protein